MTTTTASNGFDLHAISGNLCRCTGYRPIKDAAFALAFPASDDELAARRTSPAPAPMATQLHDGEAAYLRPADLAEALQLLHDHEDATVVAGSTDWGVDVNLKGARAGLVVAVDRLPELRGFTVSDTEARIGAGPHPHRGRAAPRRPAAAAAGADAAVRLAADPQQRHPRRQPRHRLADRRRPAGAARPRGVGRARLDRGGAHGPAGGLLHRLPRVRTPPGRADHRGGGAAAGGRAHGVPQDREAGLRRHLVGGRRVRDRRARRRGRARRGSGSAASPPRRSGRSTPRPRSRASRGPRRPSTPPPRCSAGRARRSPTSGRARSSAPRCSGSRCASSGPSRTGRR